MGYTVEICTTHHHIAKVDTDSGDITHIINAAIMQWGDGDTQEDYDKETLSIEAIYDENNNKIWGK